MPGPFAQRGLAVQAATAAITCTEMVVSTLKVFTTTGMTRYGLMISGGYLLHSPDPYRLWFGLDLSFGVKNPIQGNGLNGQRLLHEAKEELAAAS